MISVWVVALLDVYEHDNKTGNSGTRSPKRITDNEKGHVNLIGSVQNLIALGFNHVSISKDQRLFVESFLFAYDGETRVFKELRSGYKPSVPSVP
jgi:hypothetical protein